MAQLVIGSAMTIFIVIMLFMPLFYVAWESKTTTTKRQNMVSGLLLSLICLGLSIGLFIGGNALAAWTASNREGVNPIAAQTAFEMVNFIFAVTFLVGAVYGFLKVDWPVLLGREEGEA